jgi:hypothetical protein
MSLRLVPLIGACATWLDQGFGPGTSPLSAALAQVQTRQAVTVAAWLRYPTELDAALVELTGPRPGALAAGPAEHGEPAEPWRSWVDETVVSWAACLLTHRGLARLAATAASSTEHARGLSVSFRSLVDPDERERRAAALLRHPDLVGPVADLHRNGLLSRLTGLTPNR